MATTGTGIARPDDDGISTARDGDHAPLPLGRIAFILPGLGAGGAERVVSIVANALAARGWRISIITLAAPETPSFYEYDPAIEVIGLDLPPRRENWWRALLASLTRIRRLRRALAAAAPQVAISFLTRTNVLALLATIGRDTPVIVSERNNPELQDFGPIWSRLRSLLYRRAFGLVTITQGAMDFFPPALRRRQWVIPNPVARIERVAPRNGGAKRLTAVGRLVPQKGFDLLIDAYARIAPQFPDWQLVIWGEGPERAALEARAAKLGLGDRAVLPGVSQGPGAWVADADLFVLSSRYEGWGNVLLEALSAGLPAVSFDCRWGPADMIENGVSGILVPAGDVDALAERLAELMRDPALRDRLGKAARLSAARFSTEEIISAWEAVIHEARARGPRTVRASVPMLILF